MDRNPLITNKERDLPDRRLGKRSVHHLIDLPTRRAKTEREAGSKDRRLDLFPLQETASSDIISGGHFLGCRLSSGRSFSSLLSFNKCERNKLFSLKNINGA